MESLKISRPGRNGSSVSYEPSTDPENINNKVKFRIYQGKGVRIINGVIEGAGILLKSGTFGYNDAVADRDILAEDELKLTGGLATGDGEYYTFLFYNDEPVNSPPIYYEFVSSLTYEPQPEPTNLNPNLNQNQNQKTLNMNLNLNQNQNQNLSLRKT